MQKVFFMLGETRAGKGTILRILTMLVGRPNTAFPSIETIGTPKGQENLIGKSLAQVTDMNTDNRHGGVGTIVATINAISGEDGMTIPRLYKSSWNGTLGTRIVLAGNIMPNFGSHARPLAARLLILPFEVSFEGREDMELTDKLAAELPGILNWALNGYARLLERGRFEEPEESKAAKLRLLYKSDPIHGFVAECCNRTNDPDLGTDKDVLYAAFRRYCIKSGQTSIPAVKDFTEKLISTFPGISHRRRRVGDDRERYYGGIRLNDEHARRTFRLDPQPSPEVADLIELGVANAYDLLLLDEHGWPIPKSPADAADEFGY